MNKDLTVGKIDNLLWKFCLPLFGSVIFQQMYNIADSWVAGYYIGENALAAVGNSYELTLFFIAFSFGCNIGCSVMVSRLFGAKQIHQVKSTVSTVLVAAILLCGFLVFGGLASGELLLQLMQTPNILMADSLQYLRIYILGFPFLLFYNIATGVFSGLGDSKTPFMFLASSSILNILMDVIFVRELQWEITGLAGATFLCQGISCILSWIVVVRRLKSMKTKEKTVWFSWELFHKVAKIAIPSIIQQGCISVGNIVIQSVINGYGAGVIAGYAAAVKLNNLVITSFTTLGNGISNFTAQNLGAGQFLRIRDGLKAGIKMVWLLSIPFIMLYILCGKQLMYLFMKSPSEYALHTGAQFLGILAPFYFVISVKLVSDGILRGSGMMKQFMFATIIDLCIRTILAIILSALIGPTGIWIAWPIGWIVGMLISLCFYKCGPWSHKISQI